MMKDATVSARVQSDIKTEAEMILKNLGIPVSVVINSLYRQIIYKHGLPFELTVPVEPVTLDSMSKEEFDELVRIFQLSYLHNNEVVIVDGTNDGGCDLKVYQNKREIKKCVQVTIQKQIEVKLKRDLEKVSNKVSQYGYSNKFEFYCSISISEEKVEELKKFAIDKYDIAYKQWLDIA